MCESIFLYFWGLWGKDHSLHPAEGLQGRKIHPEQWLQGSSGLGPWEAETAGVGGAGEPQGELATSSRSATTGPCSLPPSWTGRGRSTTRAWGVRTTVPDLLSQRIFTLDSRTRGGGMSPPSEGLRSVRSQASGAAPDSVSAQKPTCLH